MEVIELQIDYVSKKKIVRMKEKQHAYDYNLLFVVSCEWLTIISHEFTTKTIFVFHQSAQHVHLNKLCPKL